MSEIHVGFNRIDEISAAKNGICGTMGFILAGHRNSRPANCQSSSSLIQGGSEKARTPGAGLPESVFLRIQQTDFFRGYNCLQVLVRDNNVDQALKALKKKLQREGVFREMKLRGHFEKPSEKRAREKAEAVRRARKLARKKLQREGLLPSKPAVARGAAGGRGGPGRGGQGGAGGSSGGFGGGAGGGFRGGQSGGGAGGSSF